MFPEEHTACRNYSAYIFLPYNVIVVASWNSGENFSSRFSCVILLMFGHVLAARSFCLSFSHSLRPGGYLQGKQYTLCIYTRYLTGVRNSAAFSPGNSGSAERRKRTRRRRGGIPGRSGKVSLENPVTFRRHWGVFTACGLANPLPFLHLLRAALTATRPSLQTAEYSPFILVVSVSSSE